MSFGATAAPSIVAPEASSSRIRAAAASAARSQAVPASGEPALSSHVRISSAGAGAPSNAKAASATCPPDFIGSKPTSPGPNGARPAPAYSACTASSARGRERKFTYSDFALSARSRASRYVCTSPPRKR